MVTLNATLSCNNWHQSFPKLSSGSIYIKHVHGLSTFYAPPGTVTWARLLKTSSEVLVTVSWRTSADVMSMDIWGGGKDPISTSSSSTDNRSFFCSCVTQHHKLKLTCSGFYPPNLDSKSGASSSTFGLSPPPPSAPGWGCRLPSKEKGGSFVKCVDSPEKNGGRGVLTFYHHHHFIINANTLHTMQTILHSV